MKACFAQEMRAVDAAATAVGGVPSIILMENAALACVNELYKDLPDLKSAVIFCGKGNNGGDGFAIARHLHNRGVEVLVMLVCGSEFSGDAAVNFDIINKMGIDIEVVTDADSLKYIIRSHDAVIDAVYGTGIHGTVRGVSCDVIEAVNAYSRYTLSVDIPSGINADSGEICGVCVKADRTVTFAAYKIGMLMFPGADYTGKVTVADISIPNHVIESQNLGINVTDDKFMFENFPRRRDNSQKGDYGKVFIIAGSEGMSGAAYMSAEAALTAGSGLVTLGCPKCINPVLEAKTTEVMTLPLADSNGHLSFLAENDIIKKVKESDAVLIGPGLGRSKDAAEIVEAVLLNSASTVVVDADAINVLSRNMEILSKSACNLIFTPHAVEMARLTGLDKDYIEENRLVVSREFAEEYGSTLILKGHHTIVTAPDSRQYINITGNSGLAKGGSGDVLAGLTVSLAARVSDEATAAAMAVYIHGLAADLAMEKYGADSVAAAKIIEFIPKAICRILQVEK